MQRATYEVVVQTGAQTLTYCGPSRAGHDGLPCVRRLPVTAELLEWRYTVDNAITPAPTDEKAEATDFNRRGIQVRGYPVRRSAPSFCPGFRSRPTRRRPRMPTGPLPGTSTRSSFGPTDDIGVSLNIQIETCRITNRVSDRGTERSCWRGEFRFPVCGRYCLPLRCGKPAGQHRGRF